MKKILACLSMLAILNANCQVRDTKAEQLLNDLSNKTKSYTSIRAEFTYSMENAKAGVSEEKSGTLLVSGERYRMNAAGQLVICDGTTIWTYFKDANEVQINSTSGNDDVLTPNKLLSSYLENYKPKIIKNKGQTVSTESVELIPSKPKNFTKAILTLDKAKMQIVSFMLFEKNGNIFTYKITKFQTNLAVSASDFTFDPAKFPGVEVNDMR